MCEVVTTAITSLFAGGAAGTAGAAATGATAAATTLQNVGTLLAVGGTAVSAVQGYRAARSQERLLRQQQEQERIRNATQDQRERRQFASMIAQQRAELAGRGVQLDSPAAVYLGQSAAREMAFQSQATRQGGQATQTELSTSARIARMRGSQSLLTGGLSAAGQLLQRAPDMWPELLS